MRNFIMNLSHKVLLTAVLLYCNPALYCKPDFSAYFSDSLLMIAIEDKQSPKEIKRIIAEGADVNEVDSEYIRRLKPVLRYALDRGTDPESVEIIKMLIDADADVNDITYNRVEDQRFYGMMPLLTYAAIYSSTEIVQMLVDAGARDKILSDDTITFKKSAFMIAQELGKMDVAVILKEV